MHAPRTVIQIINARHVVIKSIPPGDVEIEASDEPDYDSDASASDVSDETTDEFQPCSDHESDSDSDSSNSTDEYVPSNHEQDDDSDSCLGLFETSDDDTDDDAESDLSETETKDGQVDDCPVDNVCEESQNAQDTGHGANDTDDEYDTIWCHQCESPRQLEAEKHYILLHVTFTHRNGVHTEKFVIPKDSLDASFSIAKRMHISKLPIEMYTVVRDSIVLQSLIGVGAQYEIMTRMFDRVEENTRIPVFTRLGDATPLISDIVETIINI